MADIVRRVGDNRRAVLTSEILDLKRQIRRTSQQAAEAALEIGKRLIEMKGLLNHGEWLPFLKTEVQLSVRSAQDYMALVNHDIKSAMLAHLGMAGALRMIRINVDRRERRALERQRKDDPKDNQGADFDRDDRYKQLPRCSCCDLHFDSGMKYLEFPYLSDIRIYICQFCIFDFVRKHSELFAIADARKFLPALSGLTEHLSNDDVRGTERRLREIYELLGLPIPECVR